MIVTIKPRNEVQCRDSYYKIACVKCGAEFICSSKDISSQRRLNGAKWVTCPECGECIYWSPNYVNNSIQTISEQEYNDLRYEFEVISNVSDNIEKEND